MLVGKEGHPYTKTKQMAGLLPGKLPSGPSSPFSGCEVISQRNPEKIGSSPQGQINLGFLA